jgi:hypothetical protein
MWTVINQPVNNPSVDTCHISDFRVKTSFTQD